MGAAQPAGSGPVSKGKQRYVVEIPAGGIPIVKAYQNGKELQGEELEKVLQVSPLASSLAGNIPRRKRDEQLTEEWDRRLQELRDTFRRELDALREELGLLRSALQELKTVGGTLDGGSVE